MDKLFLLLAGLGLGLLSCGKHQEAPAEDEQEDVWVGWQVSQPVAQPYTLDQLPGITHYQGTLYMLGNAGTMWNNADDNTWNGWALRKGSSMEDLVELSQPRMDANFPYLRTEGNDWCYYWLMGLWVDESTGVFYSIAYSEYNYMNEWASEAKERRLGLAMSDDQGKTWTYEGDIVTQDKSSPPPANSQYYGVGDISFSLPGDGYAYIYYKKGYYSLTTLDRTQQDISVARCALNDRLAPGKWKKFYDGQWDEAGLGGKESVVIPFVNIATVAYNIYLDRFVCIGNAPSGRSFISFATDMERQDWTERDFSFPDITSFYNWQVNREDSNPHHMGQQFELYTAGLDVLSGQRTGFRYTITFTKE